MWKYHTLCLLCHRKILSADTVAASQDSAKDEANKEKEIETSVSESCTGDSMLSLSVNISLEKPDKCVDNSASGHLPNVESAMLDSKDTTETSTSMSNADNDTADDVQFSSASAVQSDLELRVSDVVQSVPGETDADTQSSAAVADCSEHQTEAGSRTMFEQTGTLTHDGDTTLSDKSIEHLQSKGQDSPLHGDSDVKISSESANDLQSDLSHALLNEVNRHL